MLSYTQGRNLYGSVTQNTSTQNLLLYDRLSNTENRYLLQKYFNNEGSFSITTVGQVALTVSAALSIGATSATLTVAWPYQSTTAYVTFSDGSNVLAGLTNGSTGITWQGALIGTQFSITTSLAIGATSATLQSAWTYPSGAYLTAFSSGEQKSVTYTNGSAAISWTGGLLGAAGNTINACTIAANSAASIGGVQFYNLPPNFSKLKDVTITVGVLKWTLREVRTREDWDNQNVFPYYADIPQNFFIYPGGDHGAQLGIWPIPSTTGNTITFNYKFRVPDLSMVDYGAINYTSLVGVLSVGDTITAGGVTATISSFTASNITILNPSGTFATGAFTTSGGASGTISSVGTIVLANGSITVTGTGTAFIPTTNQQLESRWIQIQQPDGDNLWYQVAKVNSTTSLTLFQPYQGISISGSTAWTIGQMPLLQEDFQDMLVWRSLVYYYSSIVDNQKKAQEFQSLYGQKKEMLAEYSGSTTVNVNLSPRGQGRNPNLFPYKLQG